MLQISHRHVTIKTYVTNQSQTRYNKILCYNKNLLQISHRHVTIKTYVTNQSQTRYNKDLCSCAICRHDWSS
jgi:hypothetical protein